MALDVVLVTTMQRVVPADRLARVDGILGALSTGGALLGNLLAAPLLALVGLRPALVVASLLPAGLALTGLTRTGRLDDRSAVAVAELAPRLQALQGVVLLQGLPVPAIERLAAAAVEVEVPAGTVVLREGEPADDLYVLVEGSAQASAGDRVLSTMSAPDLFGEIGVLQHRPRTATVQAVGDCRLLRISGEQFLQAMTAGPLGAPLAAAMQTRLARSGHA